MWPELDFHFIRPLWLLFIPYAVWQHMELRRAYSAALQWQGAIAPELLEHLTVAGRGRKRLRPYQLMTLLLILMSLVVAGPTWERETTPFTEDHAPLVIAIELTPSMLGVDQQPTRLDRARFKLRDVLERRRGARTAVIGYAGSAHLLLPFTDDTDLLEVYLESLHPDLMPVAGDNPGEALAMATTLLQKETVPGTLLFLTDGIDADEGEAFSRFTIGTGAQLVFLGFGSDEGSQIKNTASSFSFGDTDKELAPPLNRAGLLAVSEAANGRFIATRLDANDVDAVMRRIRRHLVDTLDQDEALAWKDRGYPLVWGVAACMIVWFRRGWTVQWRV